MEYEQCRMPKRADRNESVLEWGCSGCLVRAHASVPASQKAQKVITGFLVVMGNMQYVTHSATQTKILNLQST